MIRTSFFLLAACLLSACGSLNYVGIQTYNPAEVTFPEGVSKVLVVNNAVPQPSDAGYQYKLYGMVQDTSRARADSALFDACRTLGKSIFDISFFDDVLLNHKVTRQDDQYMTDRKLTSEQVTALCEETGADAIISLDRLLFDMSRNVVAFSEGYVLGEVDVKIAGVLRSYLPGRDNPLATVYMADSIYWSESADNLNMLNRYLPAPEEALRAAGQFVGAKATPNFVPHWEDETRWYYGGSSAAWKEASAYAAAEKWDAAAGRWEYLYKTTSGWKGKAKAAANLALYSEMNTNLKEAYDWATKSFNLFKVNSGDANANTQLLKLYVEALAGRLRSDKKLNMQFGRE